MRSEWAWRPLGDVFRIHREGINPGAHPAEIFEHYSLPAFDETGGPAIQVGSEIESNKSNLSLPVILVSKLNPRKPRVMLVTGSSGLRRCASTEWIPYVPQIVGVDLVYYKWLFGSTGFSGQLEKVATGSTNSHVRVSPSETFRWNVPYPPLPEQRRIAEILDTIDEAIRKTEQVIAKLQQMKQGLLHDLLTRGIDENGGLRDPERHPEKFKNSPLGRIPKGWKVRHLADIAEIRSGIAKNTNKAVNDPVLVHYLRVANVQDGYLDLSQMSKIRIASEDVKRYAVQDGDVLMNEGGDLDKLGRGGIWRGQFDPCVHQNHVFAVRCGSDLLPDLLDAWTGSPAARRYFMLAGKQTTNLASINKTALGRLPVAVPLDSEQKFIIDALQLHQDRGAAEASELVKLRYLKQGLMDDLLIGRVRVTVPEEGIA